MNEVIAYMNMYNFSGPTVKNLYPYEIKRSNGSNTITYMHVLLHAEINGDLLTALLLGRSTVFSVDVCLLLDRIMRECLYTY
jgi:hypothetical protein